MGSTGKDFPAATWMLRLFWACVALAAAWAVVSLWWPLGHDGGLYSWVGHVILNGGVQYRDAWDMHGPLVGYITALGGWVFGERPMGLRALDLVFLAIGCWGASRLVRPLAGRNTGRWSAVLLVFSYSSFSFAWTLQPEGWIAFASMATFVPVFDAVNRGERASTRALLIAAAACGCFALIKPFYGLFVLVPLLAAWFVESRATIANAHSRPSLRDVVRPTATLAAGSLAIVGIMLLWFAGHGALSELLDVHVLYTSRVYGGTAALQLKERLIGMSGFLQREPVLAGTQALAITGFVLLWRSGRRAVSVVILMWFAIAVFCVLLQGKFYPYHWLPTLPPILLFVTTALAALFSEPPRSAARTLGYVSFFVVLAKASVPPASHVASWSLYITGVRSEERYYSRFIDFHTARDQRSAASHLSANTLPHETFAVWGYDAGLFMLADRPTPFRLAGWNWALIEGSESVRRSYQEEYLADVLRTKPRYMVIDTKDDADGRPPTLREFVALDSLLLREYTRDTAFGPLALLRRHAP